MSSNIAPKPGYGGQTDDSNLPDEGYENVARTCPVCGEKKKNLPLHIPACVEGSE